MQLDNQELVVGSRVGVGYRTPISWRDYEVQTVDKVYGDGGVGVAGARFTKYGQEWGVAKENRRCLISLSNVADMERRKERQENEKVLREMTTELNEQMKVLVKGYLADKYPEHEEMLVDVDNHRVSYTIGEMATLVTREIIGKHIYGYGK